jgi:hypothetical protein
MALHVYLYLQAETVADIVVDATRLARDPDHLATMETQLRALCGMNLSFDDVRDERRPDPHFDSAAIDWTAIREHGRAAAAALAGIGDDQILAGRAEVLIDATFVEMHEASQPASRPMLLAAAG